MKTHKSIQQILRSISGDTMQLQIFVRIAIYGAKGWLH
uniref:Uncharacterized protein n=1 Tax=Rhizophora mucronata TaxID=61149 RepID=A0A2P2N2A2_RHIMU